jgi:hypothetical protein
MKSYFAKLAARATLANAPVPPPATAPEPFDPFADMSVPDNAISTPASVVRDIPTNQLASPDSARFPLEHVTKVLPPVESDSTFIAPVETTVAPPLIPSLERGPTSQFQQPASQQQPASEVVPRTESVSVVPPTHFEEHDDSEAERTRNADVGLMEIERAQTLLLRRADAFMESMLKHRQRSASRESEDERKDPETEPSPQPVVERRTVLQPVRHMQEVHDSDEGRPSLVIGKLTVEVVPPAVTLPPVPAPRTVVVVRRDSNDRAAMVSSQRFGLGQS